MTLLYHLFFSWKEYSLEKCISNLQKDLLKLKSKIMDGDYSAAHIAREKLSELEEKNIEFINS